MAKILGNGGSVTFTSTSGNWGAGVIVNSVQKWSGQYDGGLQDVTTFGSNGHPEYMNGNTGFSGNLTMNADGTTPLAFVGTTNPSVELLMATGRKISGTAVLSNMSIEDVNSNGTPILVSFDFSFTGSFTVA